MSILETAAGAETLSHSLSLSQIQQLEATIVQLEGKLEATTKSGHDSHVHGRNLDPERRIAFLSLVSSCVQH